MHRILEHCGVACVACVVAAALESGVFAQDLSSIPIAVAPVTVKIDSNAEFSAIEVSNRGKRPTSVEAEMVRVKWVDGREQYEATRDFTVSPPVFRLPDGKSRMVRFRYAGLRSETEGFYRLFIRQLPEEIAGNQISMVFNLGVPVFVAPFTSRMALSMNRPPGRAPELHNTGNVTVTVLALEGGGCPQGAQQVMARISPAQKLVLKDLSAACATSARTDRGMIQLNVH